MDGSRRRQMILYPYGPPAAEHAQVCTRLSFAMGADLARVHDGPFPSISRFIQYAGRIPLLRDGVLGAERPIVLLTETSPLMLRVVEARRTIEAAVPALAGAMWALFVDPKRDSDFGRRADEIGTLAGDLPFAPVWTAKSEMHFLVLSPSVGSDEMVHAGVALLEDLCARRARQGHERA